MADKEFDERLKRLDKTANYNRYRNSDSERRTLVEKAKKTGLEVAGVGFLGYVAGVLIPIVSGGTIAGIALAYYGGRKILKACKARKYRKNPLERELKEEE